MLPHVMRRAIALLVVACLAPMLGCRREDWREMRTPLPEGCSAERAIRALTWLDPQTPPEIAEADGVLIIRYNSLHLAPQNFLYVLKHLPEE